MCISPQISGRACGHFMGNFDTAHFALENAPAAQTCLSELRTAKFPKFFSQEILRHQAAEAPEELHATVRWQAVQLWASHWRRFQQRFARRSDSRFLAASKITICREFRTGNAGHTFSWRLAQIAIQHRPMQQNQRGVKQRVSSDRRG